MKLMALIVALLLFLAGFSGLFRHIVTTPIDVSPIAPTRIAKSPALDDDWSIAAPDTLLGNAEISATLARPLFSHDRRRFIPPIEPELPSEISEVTTGRNSEASDLVLLGVSLGAGQSQALVASRGASGIWVKPGDSVHSWTVEEIRPNEVNLTRGSQTAKLELYPQNGE